MIESFYIKALYGERDVEITFTSPYKIIVADNGYGKTTILNAFYALVSGDTAKLRKIEFNLIGIKFNDGTNLSFRKTDFSPNIETLKNHHFFDLLEKNLGLEMVYKLLDEARTIPAHRIETGPLFRHTLKTVHFPSSLLKDFLRENRLSNGVSTKTKEKLDTIRQRFPYKCLHLPTYRRVEEDIKAFGGAPEEIESLISTINFGMSDVKDKIEKITSEIIKSSVEWFSKINGQMLSQLVNGFNVTPKMIRSIKQPKAVEVVLERIGKNITEPQKEQILGLVRSGEIFTGHDPLIYFVANLLTVYEQQQDNDSAIQQFTHYCNKYLSDKEFVYDESSVKISITRKKNKSPVDIETLSSGEKQIISLFALLYLQKTENIAIFFDEPELSLSIEWQRTLIPDIMESGKCKFLLCTTHSPFIFDNELVAITVDLSGYIKEL
ncbi:AAA family ATPase [Pseudomonas sp. S37]|uniref:AAA family ATPase n=1 Tax=Pseudomonas sp. S37 TaxID=2767449 RepID=UPI0019116F47|nr:AAA family ATPase [Pseudomonas sp. S37]MBK4996794.1 AAA family ATPase [Pseudomonas sp. S37]